MSAGRACREENKRGLPLEGVEFEAIPSLILRVRREDGFVVPNPRLSANRIRKTLESQRRLVIEEIERLLDNHCSQNSRLGPKKKVQRYQDVRKVYIDTTRGSVICTIAGIARKIKQKLHLPHIKLKLRLTRR